MDYLLRLTEPDEYDNTLQLFGDEQELGDYLAQITETAQVSGLGPLIAGLWCWDDKDRREELELILAQTESEEEWLYMLYWVTRKSDGKRLFSFTARVRERDMA